MARFMLHRFTSKRIPVSGWSVFRRFVCFPGGFTFHHRMDVPSELCLPPAFGPAVAAAKPLEKDEAEQKQSPCLPIAYCFQSENFRHECIPETHDKQTEQSNQCNSCCCEDDSEYDLDANRSSVPPQIGITVMSMMSVSFNHNKPPFVLILPSSV